MPRVRRHDFPPGLFQHLLDRIQSPKIPPSQLELLVKWLDGDPDVPQGLWYKRFSGMTVCGEGELIKTFLLPGQAPKGKLTRTDRGPCGGLRRQNLKLSGASQNFPRVEA